MEEMETPVETSLATLLPMNADLLLVILINFVIVTALLVSVKYIAAAVTHVRADDELAIRDNPAFGISLCGVILGVLIMMTGTMTSEAALDLKLQAMMIAGYGVLGIALMSFSRLIFDKLSMPRFSITQEILKRNTAAAVVDFSNVIATALIIRAAMFWVNSYSWEGAVMILVAFVISQLFLTAASLFRLKLYRLRYGSSLQEQIAGGNLAVAWQFSGYRIGVALAITAASRLIPYAYEEFFYPMLSWVAASALMWIVVAVISPLAVRIILSGIDIHQEVDKEANLAIGLVQGTLYVAMGMLVSSLMF